MLQKLLAHRIGSQVIDKLPAILKDGGPISGLCEECSNSKLFKYKLCDICDQANHTDFDYAKVDTEADHRRDLDEVMAFSFVGPLTKEGCTLYLPSHGYIQLEFGEFLFFRGDIQHSGVGYDLTKGNHFYRLHGYISTAEQEREQDPNVYFRGNDFKDT